MTMIIVTLVKISISMEFNDDNDDDDGMIMGMVVIIVIVIIKRITTTEAIIQPNNSVMIRFINRTKQITITSAVATQ